MRDPSVEAACSEALSTFDGENFERLSLRRRVLVAIWGLEAEVNNGGFDQDYLNGAGDPGPLRARGVACDRSRQDGGDRGASQRPSSAPRALHRSVLCARSNERSWRRTEPIPGRS